jgi:hypothetical protein
MTRDEKHLKRLEVKASRTKLLQHAKAVYLSKVHAHGA